MDKDSAPSEVPRASTEDAPKPDPAREQQAPLQTFEIVPYSKRRPPRMEPAQLRPEPPCSPDFVPPPSKSAGEFPSAGNILDIFHSLARTETGAPVRLEDCIIISADTWARNNRHWEQRLYLKDREHEHQSKNFERTLHKWYQDEFSQEIHDQIVAKTKLAQAQFEHSTGVPTRDVENLKSDNDRLQHDINRYKKEIGQISDVSNMAKNEILALKETMTKKDREIDSLKKQVRRLEDGLTAAQKNTTNLASAVQGLTEQTGIGLMQNMKHLVNNAQEPSSRIEDVTDLAPVDSFFNQMTRDYPSEMPPPRAATIQPQVVPDKHFRTESPDSRSVRRRVETESPERSLFNTPQPTTPAVPSSRGRGKTPSGPSGLPSQTKEGQEKALAHKEKAKLIPFSATKGFPSMKTIVENSKAARRVLNLFITEEAIRSGYVEPGDLTGLRHALCGGRMEWVIVNKNRNRLTAAFVHPFDAYRFIEFMNDTQDGLRTRRRYRFSVEWRDSGKLPINPDLAQAISDGASRRLLISNLPSTTSRIQLNEQVVEALDSGPTGKDYIVNIEISHNSKNISPDAIVEFTHIDRAISVKIAIDEWKAFRGSTAIFREDNFWMNSNGKLLTPESKHNEIL